MAKKCIIPLCFIFAVALSAAAQDAAAQLPNPLKNIKTGQWVRYRINAMFGTAEQKQTVLDITGSGDDRLITIKTEMSLDDEVVDEREETYTYSKMLEEQTKALEDVENVTFTSKEEELSGVKISTVQVGYEQDGEKFTLVLSENVPVIGLIRLQLESVDEPIIELIDFGD